MILNYGNKLVSPVMLVAPLMRNDTPLSNNFIKIIKSSPRFAVFAFCICVLCLYFVFCIEKLHFTASRLSNLLQSPLFRQHCKHIWYFGVVELNTSGIL